MRLKDILCSLVMDGYSIFFCYVESLCVSQKSAWWFQNILLFSSFQVLVAIVTCNTYFFSKVIEI